MRTVAWIRTPLLGPLSRDSDRRQADHESPIRVLDCVEFREVHGGSCCVPVLNSRLLLTYRLQKAQYETPATYDFAIGPHALRFDSLVLVAVVNNFEDVWQAEVALDVGY